VPDAFERAVMRCLEKDPARRFARIGELARAIAPFGSGDADVAVGRISKLERVAASGERPSSKTKLLILGAAAIAAAGIVARLATAPEATPAGIATAAATEAPAAATVFTTATTAANAMSTAMTATAAPSSAPSAPSASASAARLAKSPPAVITARASASASAAKPRASAVDPRDPALDGR
jgi:serine/threonine-protein kinase